MDAGEMDYQEFKTLITEALPEIENDPLLLKKGFVYYCNYGEELYNNTCAEFLGTTSRNLHVMRSGKRGPVYRKTVRVRYPLVEVLRYILNGATQTSEAQGERE